MFRSGVGSVFEVVISDEKLHGFDLSEYEDNILSYKKNGRYVVNPNKIHPIIPEIKLPNTLMGLLISRLLFIRYHKLNNIVRTDIKDPNAKQ